MVFLNGLYIGAYFKDKMFISILDDILLNIKNKFQDLDIIPPEYDPHITIMYSEEVPVGNPEELHLPSYLDISFKDIDVFPYNTDNVNGSAIVLKVESVIAKKLHNKIKETYKTKPTYEEYTPHITIGLVNGIYPKDLLKILNNRIHIPNHNYTNLLVTYSIEDLS